MTHRRRLSSNLGILVSAMVSLGSIGTALAIQAPNIIERSDFSSNNIMEYVVSEGDNLKMLGKIEGLLPDQIDNYVLVVEALNKEKNFNGYLIAENGKLRPRTTILLPDINDDGYVGTNTELILNQ